MQVFVHQWMFESVLPFQGRVLFFSCVSMAGLVVRPLDSSETAFEGRALTRLTFMAMVEAEDAHKDCALSEISAETTPERVPTAGLVIDARDLQEPVPDCNHNVSHLYGGISYLRHTVIPVA